MPVTEDNGNTIKYRVTELEKKIDCLDNKVERKINELDVKFDRVMENHLPHLQTELEALKAKVTVLATINLFALILGIVFAILYR